MRTLIATTLLALLGACTVESETHTPTATDHGTAEHDAVGADHDTGAAPTPTTENHDMTATAAGLYALKTNALDGHAVDLSDYAGKVTLVVNVASKCGYTPQYAGLQALHAELSDEGFAVLGFPCNAFGGQEPGSPEQIAEFCSANFGVTFPMMAKCEVAGSGQSDVYAFLQEQTGEVPNWNFCKYLVGKDGQVIAFFKSGTAPDSAELRQAIEKALG